MTNEVTRIIPNRSIETAKLIDRLKDGKPGDVLTDEQLTEIANGLSTAVRGDGYARLHSAMRYVLREHHVHWSRIPRAGAIKCLDSSEVVDSISSDLRSIHRRASRTKHKMGAMKLEGMSVEQQRHARALGSQAMTISLFSTGGTTKKLEARSIGEPINPSRMLELFTQRNGKDKP